MASYALDVENKPGHQTVQALVDSTGFAFDTAEFAAAMDEQDELKNMRTKFHFPPTPEGGKTIYL